MSINNINKVYLVGAGPGDEGLITLKGKECIQNADVIIYDRLVNKDLLKYMKDGCETIYVGKQSSNHIMPQDKINYIIAQKAKEGKNVVRLKGGDPYVFGRGAEEAEVLFDEGIDFEIVPGVTSAIGGLCYAGIPVTHRDFASSFHVVTGHAKKDDSLDINWKALAEEKGTVIFLMGIGNISHITKMLIDNGRRIDTPVAFVSWATNYKQRTVVSTLEKAEDLVKSEHIVAPALFVVGDVVSMTDKLGFFERKSLFGTTIAVTRTRNKNSELRKMLESMGARVIEIPTLNVEANISAEKEIMDRLGKKKYDCIAFTSHNAVDYFFDVLKKNKVDMRLFHDTKIASIGKATTEFIEYYGIYPDIEAKDFSADALAREIISIGISGNILYPCSEIATDCFEAVLSSECIEVDRVNIYKNTVNKDIDEDVIDILKCGEVDYITFTSSSTFKYMVEILGEDRDILQNMKKVSIGPVTSNTIISHGMNVDIQSQNATIDSMLEAIIEDKKKKY